MEASNVLPMLKRITRRASKLSVAYQMHRYQLNPPLSEKALGKLEAENGLALPESYRHFLRTIGNGGAGPYGGILPLEESLARWRNLLGKNSIKPILAASCPLDAKVTAADVLPLDPDPARHASLIDEGGSYYKKIQKSMLEVLRRHRSGTLTVCDYGCGDSFFIILGGRRCGEVWVDCLENYGGLFPLNVDFDTWYSNWLERTLAEVEKRTPPFAGDQYFEYAVPFTPTAAKKTAAKKTAAKKTAAKRVGQTG